jgi:hypothetical protein
MKAQWSPRSVFKRTAGADRQPLMSRAVSVRSNSRNHRNRDGHCDRRGRPRPAGSGHHDIAHEDRAARRGRHHKDRSCRAPRSHGNDERTMTTRLFLQGSVQRSRGVPRPRRRAICFEHYLENEDQDRQCASRPSLTCYRAEAVMTPPLRDDRGSKELSVCRITTGTQTP